MNKKTVIEIVVSILAFAGAGFVLYNGLKSAPAAPVAVSKTRAIANLPIGTTLDFQILHQQNFQFQSYHYPELSAQSEVGIDPQNLVKPQANTP